MYKYKRELNITIITKPFFSSDKDSVRLRVALLRDPSHKILVESRICYKVALLSLLVNCISPYSTLRHLHIGLILYRCRWRWFIVLRGNYFVELASIGAFEHAAWVNFFRVLFVFIWFLQWLHLFFFAFFEIMLFYFLILEHIHQLYLSSEFIFRLFENQRL